MISLSVIFNRNLHFNFLHLFSFSNSVASPAPSVTETSRDRLTDQNVERLLRIAENHQQQLIQQNRVFVEDIQIRPALDNTAAIVEENPDKEGYENAVAVADAVTEETITSTTEENNEISTNIRQRFNTDTGGAGDS